MWTKEQKMAIEKKNSNILVSASAGSGKTAVLVERVISTCIKEKVDIDKILVVTFTNASAIELKERLMSAIYKALETSKDVKFLKRQLNLINRASITTIHSFCLELIRSNFYNLEIDPNFRIADDVESKLLKSKAIQNVIEKKYQEYNEQSRDLKKDGAEINLYDILELFSGKEESLIEEILKIYNYSLSFPYPFEYLKNSIEKYNVKDLDKDLYEFDFGKQIVNDTLGDINILKKRAELLLEEINGMEDFLKYFDVLQDDVRILESILINSKDSWDKLYQELNKDAFKNNPRYSGQNVELKEKLMHFRTKVLKESIKKMKLSIYATSNEILLQNASVYKYLKYLYDILSDLDVEYKSLKSKKNVIDFSDIEHLALKLLVKNTDGKYEKTEISKSLSEEFYEVYTDEYQDTSYVQEAILNAVSKEDNRFMVGDIKQSIYKFRQAMPEIFNNKYTSYKSAYDVFDDDKNCKIILDKNFRSKKIVLDSINYIFEKIMSMQNGDSDYNQSETLKAGNLEYKDYENQSYKTELNIIDLEKGNETNDEFDKFIEDRKEYEIEAEAIAIKIQDLVDNFKIYDMKLGEFRKTNYKDIVILLRSVKDKSVSLEKVLKEHKIPVFSDQASSLLESDEVRLVISFLKVLDNPLQDINLASVMYSIIGNFSLDELVYIRGNQKKINFYYNIIEAKKELEEKEKITEFEQKVLEKINNFVGLLNKFNEYKHIFSISELLTRIYKETNLYYQFALEENSGLKKANLNILIDIAIKFEGNENKTLSSYIEYIDNMKNKADSVSSAKTIGENEDVTRIMTIHKSKGLEFPIVILSDTNKKYNLRDKSSTIIAHHNLGLGINVVNKELGITYPSIIKRSISSLIDEETRSEELRMLYVALTRAKEKLIIYSTVKNYDKFKDKEMVLYEGQKIDPYIIAKNNSYFQNIHMCMKSYDSSLFELNVIKAGELINNIKEDEKVDYRDKFEKESGYEKEDASSVEQILKYEYPYKNYVEAKRRIGVSDLKKESIENSVSGDKDTTNAINIKDKYSLENVNLLEKKISANTRGTITHFILQNIDFNIRKNEQLEEYLNDLINKGVLSKEQLESVDKDSIIKFLNSNVAEKIRNSDYVRREEEFIFKDEDISFSQIQGIIDLYFVDDSDSDKNFVLLDFKTDREKDESVIARRYKIQLDIYAKALEKITGKKVSKKIIYSLYLDKEILV